MSIKRKFETAPDAGARSALRHYQMRTEMAFRHHLDFVAVERA